MHPIFEKMGAYGIVPVVVINDENDALPLAKALCDGNLACAEVTFRTKAAPEAIRMMTQAYPDMLVGAGTVLTTAQVDEAIAAGAKFIVSPGLNPEVVKYCQKQDIPVCPGIVTPTEIELALSLGLDFVKFFPAEPSGGLSMIKAIAAPYTMLKFMPTGGISPDNVREYLKYDRILACGGSWMVKDALINSGDFEKITALTKEAANIVKEIRG